MGRPLAGSVTLTEAAEWLGVPLPTMFRWAREEWFPEPVAVLAGTPVFDLSMIALMAGLPLHGRLE